MTSAADIWARMAELAEQATHQWGEPRGEGTVVDRSQFDGVKFAALLREEAAKSQQRNGEAPAAAAPICGSQGCREPATVHAAWPGQPIDLCVGHLAKARVVAVVMGFDLAVREL